MAPDTQARPDGDERAAAATDSAAAEIPSRRDEEDGTTAARATTAPETPPALTWAAALGLTPRADEVGVAGPLEPEPASDGVDSTAVRDVATEPAGAEPRTGTPGTPRTSG
ncbi:hypothetical protein, partial [Streptomyces antimicrobicus]